MRHSKDNFGMECNLWHLETKNMEEKATLDFRRRKREMENLKNVMLLWAAGYKQRPRFRLSQFRVLCALTFSVSLFIGSWLDAQRRKVKKEVNDRIHTAGLAKSIFGRLASL